MIEPRQWAVFVPAEHEGVVGGWDLVRVDYAADEREAIVFACARWFGTGAIAGTYIVAPLEQLEAYEVDETRVPIIKAAVSLPVGPSPAGTRKTKAEARR